MPGYTYVSRRAVVATTATGIAASLAGCSDGEDEDEQEGLEDGTIAVTVQDQEGDPIDDAVISINGDEQEVDDNGETYFEDNDEGEYEVRAEADEYQDGEAEAIIDDLSTSASLTIPLEKNSQRIYA